MALPASSNSTFPPPAQQQVGSILCALPSFWTTIENHKSVSSRPDFIHHQPTTHSINHQSVSQSVSHSISQSVSQPASQSVSQSVSQTSESQPAARQAGRQAGSSQSVSQSVSQASMQLTRKSYATQSTSSESHKGNKCKQAAGPATSLARKHVPPRATKEAAWPWLWPSVACPCQPSVLAVSHAHPKC